MIKCLFVDVKSINSEIPKTEFDDAQIEALADLILATDGLIRPLILTQTSVNHYAVVEGHLAYYAAVRAKQKDLRTAEMVNAFVIPESTQKFATAQLTLLAHAKQLAVTSSTATTRSIVDTDSQMFDRIFTQMLAAIAQQLQPLQQQLSHVSATVDRHTETLASLIASAPKLEPVATVSSIVEIVEPIIVIPPSKTPKPPSKTTKKPPKTSQAKIEPPQVELPESNPPLVAQAAKPTTSSTKQSTPKRVTTTTKTAPDTPKERVKPDPLVAADPDKSAKTLNLINTLDLNTLTRKMLQAVGGKGIDLLATNIIAIRDIQPAQKFESWSALISAKVTKLTPAMALKIIEKLK